MLDPGFYDVPNGHVATIVTHLEMRRPPANLGKARFPDGVRLARQTDPCLDTYRDLFRRVGGLPWLWWTRLTLTDEVLTARLTAPGVELTYLLKDDTPEGLLELLFRDDGVCEVAYFGLTPALVGSGAGRALMTTAITRAFQEEITKLYLHTCTLDSPQALGFYRHMGFTPFKQQVEIAEDPRLTGVLPRDAGPNTPLFFGS